MKLYPLYPHRSKLHQREVSVTQRHDPPGAGSGSRPRQPRDRGGEGTSPSSASGSPPRLSQGGGRPGQQSKPAPARQCQLYLHYKDKQRCADPSLSSNIFNLGGWYFLKIVYSVAKYLFYTMYIVATLATQEILSYRRMKTRRANLQMHQQDAQRCAIPCLSPNIFNLGGWYFVKIVNSIGKYLFYTMYIVATLATQEILSYRRMKTCRAHIKMHQQGANAVQTQV